jgi:hypothetical protein
MGQRHLRLVAESPKTTRQAELAAIRDIALDTMREAGLTHQLMDEVLRDPDAVTMIIDGR